MTSQHLPSHQVTGNPKGSPIDPEDVVSVIAKLHFDIKENATTGYREYLYSQSLAEMIHYSTNLTTFALSPPVERSIAGVSQLFAEIHQENTIADSIKALLFSIVIPVFKSALCDKNFFVDGSDSTIRFINEFKNLSPFLIVSTQAKKDIFYKKLVYLVDEINDQHGKDSEIFSKSLKKLESLVESEKKRRNLLLQRTQEMEEVKSRQEEAHSRVRAAIAVRTYKKDIPKITRNFIDKQWESVLFFHFNRNEEKRSEEFSSALHNLELLIDASLGKRIDLKALFDALDKDMALLAFPQNERLESLQPLLNEIKERQASSAPNVVKTPLPTPVAAPAPKKDWDPSATMVIPAFNPEPESMEDDFDYLAAECRPNTRFRLALPDTEKQVVKLAVIMKAGGEYIFIDQRGVKVLMVSRREVAEKLRNGALVIIETPQSFEKALETLVKSRSNT